MRWLRNAPVGVDPGAATSQAWSGSGASARSSNTYRTVSSENRWKIDEYEVVTQTLESRPPLLKAF